ncbi:MAG: transcriptional regulator NrdR [Candidatus Kerfeldbacteria bacterium]|jgi:transcriptional repressor NrdR
MKCPACQHADSKVTDSRLINEGMAIRRRRECLKCSFRFSTYEEVEILNLTVIKRDGGTELYSKDKLESGIRKSFEKIAITQDNFKRLLNRIERDIQHTGNNHEIKASKIGDIIMKHLRRVDEVAYIRFASVYRSFKDAKAFQRELKKIIKKNK